MLLYRIYHASAESYWLPVFLLGCVYSIISYFVVFFWSSAFNSHLQKVMLYNLISYVFQHWDVFCFGTVCMWSSSTVLAFLCWFSVVFCVDHKLVSAIHQHHIDVLFNILWLWLACLQVRLDIAGICLDSESTCHSSLGGGMWSCLTIHFSDNGWPFTPLYWK